ncbi:MAG: hypothetical protein RLZZ618_2690, partial [Pseudomonadota bacterium]
MNPAQSLSLRRSGVLLFSRRVGLAAAALLLASQAFAADLTVSAAASLTNAFKELAPIFEAQNP